MSLEKFIILTIYFYFSSSFPWFFTGSNSLQDFINNKYELLFLAIIKNSVRALDTLGTMIEISPKATIKELLPNCFSHLLPIEAGCIGIKYETKAEQMKQKMDGYFSAVEQKSELLRRVAQVIGCVLENVSDREKFKEICGFELEVHKSEELIDCASFDKCLNHLKTNFSIPASQSIITFFCGAAKFCHFIEKLLLMSKKKVQNTSLKEHKMLYLLQYCVLVEKLFDYLTGPVTHNIKGFIIRDVTNFLCFLILDENFGMRLRETATNFLSTFLKKILPVCAEETKPFLNKIVSSLVTVCGNFKSDFEKKSLTIIQFLVIKQSEVLEDEIANLDNFPDRVEFNALREHQLNLKYKNGTFTLVQEIEHFLKIKQRKVEGLVALREHLAKNKSELKLLFDNISSTLGFSEDGENSLLHKLVRSLVSCARNSFDSEERAIEAVKCLGEIGCYDLSTMVFISEDHQKTAVYEKIESSALCQQMICREALNQMETMLLHSNPRLFESASNACYHMMESKPAQGYTPSIYLRPFYTNTISAKFLFYEEPKRDKKFDFTKILRNEEFSTYKTWIKRVVESMMHFTGDKVLEKVSSAQKTFAELMSPLMLKLLLSYDQPEVNDEIIAGVNFFFDSSAEKLNYPERVNEGSIFLDKLAIRQMLKLVECIRIHSRDYRRSNMAEKLKLNFLNIAKAAKHCEAFFTAVLYCELWAEKEKAAMFNKTLQEIMHKALTSIGIHDAWDLFVNPSTKRPLYLQLAGQNWQNILEHDAAGGENYLKLLNDIGLYALSHKLASVFSEKKPYECLWRLSNWDVLIESDSESTHQEEFEKFHYAGLKCLKSGDELGLKTAVMKARKATLQMLQQESLECTQNLYKFLGKSQLLQQIEDFAEIRFNNLQESREKLLSKWNAQNTLPHDFRLIEPVLSQRNSIFDTANIRMGKRTWVPEAMQSNMLHIVKESIESGCDSDAVKMIAKMRTLDKLTVTSKAELLIKEAHLSFKTNVNLAKHCLKCLQEDQEFDREYLLRSVAYRMYGEIMAESHADDIVNISNEYFKKSVSYLEKYAKHHDKSHLVADVTYNSQQVLSQQSQQMSQEDESIVDQKIKENICVFDIIAKYFDREYVARSEYIASPDFVNKIRTFDDNKKKHAEFERAANNNKSDKDLRRSCFILKKSLDIDDNEIKSVNKQKKQAAGNAMYYYLRGAMNDPNDNVLSIFRIISIWLANLDNDTILKMLNESLLKIPSYKFIVALPQLTVRLNEKTDDYSNKLLMKLLEKCAIDHPHHTLPLILALVNSYADGPDNVKEEPRVVGAKIVWKKLMKNVNLSGTMTQMEKVSVALIDLANRECIRKMPDHVLLMKHLKYVQCPTLDIPIVKDCNYSGFVTSIVQWEPQIESVGGINAPKKIACLCADGVSRPQLLKGKDDMRQDAVMIQVFGVVNQLLRDNKEMRKRHARIRIYKVVPFSRVSFKQGENS
jgi:serine-protein kinase ATM